MTVEKKNKKKIRSFISLERKRSEEKEGEE